MTTTYSDLLDEIQRGEATLLSVKRVGHDLVPFIVVQRESGGLWQAEDRIGCEAQAWPVWAMKRVWLKAEEFFPGVEINGERLFRYCNLIEGADDAARAIAAAQQVLAESRAS